MSEIKVNKISPATGTETTLGDASDKFIVPSGAELEVASGATITNAGTATNFGSSGFTLATPIVTTSGTSATWTGIPSGTTCIILSLSQFSTNTNNQVIFVRLGDAGGIETSGYYSTGLQTDGGSISDTERYTDGLDLAGYADFDVAKNWNGNVLLALQNATTFTWTMQSTGGTSNLDQLFINAGSKALSGELTQVQLCTQTGSATFDLGEANLMYQ